MRSAVSRHDVRLPDPTPTSSTPRPSTTPAHHSARRHTLLIPTRRRRRRRPAAAAASIVSESIQPRTARRSSFNELRVAVQTEFALLQFFSIFLVLNGEKKTNPRDVHMNIRPIGARHKRQ